MLSSDAVGGQVFKNVIEFNDIKFSEKKNYCGGHMFHFEHGHWGRIISDIFKCGVCEKCVKEKDDIIN